MSRLDRALGIMLQLRAPKAVTVKDLAHRFEVSTRTIHRDLDMLSAQGVPIYTQPGRGGGVRLLAEYFLPPIMLTLGEATTLLLGQTLLASLGARPFATAGDTARAKLLASVPDALRAHLMNLDRLVGFESAADNAFHPAAPGGASAGDEASVGNVVETFLLAVLQGATLTLRYKSPYRRQEETVAVVPLGSFWDRGRWYLVGRRSIGSTKDTPRVWRADRVQQIEVRAARQGARDTGRTFDVRSLLGRAWLGEAMARWAQEAPVRLRVTREQAASLRRDWYYRHAEYADLPGGQVEVRLGEDQPARVLPLVRWLGPGAELVEPASWRALLRAESEAVAEMHQDEASSAVPGATHPATG